MLARIYAVMLFLLALLFIQMPSIHAQDTGDAAIAERYADFALEAINRGDWDYAEAVLERAQSFTSVSSDISWLLALARNTLKRPVPMILEAVQKARVTDRWRSFSSLESLFLESELLLRVREYSKVLSLLQNVPESLEKCVLRLKALRWIDAKQFETDLLQAVSRYPASVELALLFCDVWENNLLSDTAKTTYTTFMSSYEYLVQTAPELSYRLAEWATNTQEAKRMIASWRADNPDCTHSLALAVRYGLISASFAIEQLFSSSTLEYSLITKIYKLCRTQSERQLLGSLLIDFTGIVLRDFDEDTYLDLSVEYQKGKIVSVSFEYAQLGFPELLVFFKAAVPDKAVLKGERVLSVYTQSEDALDTQEYSWSVYPFIDKVVKADHTYLMVPQQLVWNVLRLEKPFPEIEYISPAPNVSLLYLNERELMQNVLILERPGQLARSSLERLHFVQGLVTYSVETVGAIEIAETWFENGFPLYRLRDIDFDGYRETAQRFSKNQNDYFIKNSFLPSYSSSDWDADGIVDYSEEVLDDGSRFLLFKMNDGTVDSVLVPAHQEHQ